MLLTAGYVSAAAAHTHTPPFEKEQIEQTYRQKLLQQEGYIGTLLTQLAQRMNSRPASIATRVVTGYRQVLVIM